MAQLSREEQEYGRASRTHYIEVQPARPVCNSKDSIYVFSYGLRQEKEVQMRYFAQEPEKDISSGHYFIG